MSKRRKGRNILGSINDYFIFGAEKQNSTIKNMHKVLI